MIKVIKRGGQKEEFNLEKIKKSLISVLEKVDISQEKKNEIVDKITKEVLDFVKEKKEVFTSEIEAKIILGLDKICSSAVTLWREHRLKKKP